MIDKFILALETSSSICGVSILLNDELLSIEEKNTSRQHAELLPDLTKTSLKKINKTLDDINAIAISIGPGSFTGLRVGLGFAKGIAYAKTLPIIPVSSLLSLAYSLKREKPKQGILFSHARKVFYQTFSWRNSVPKINSEVTVAEIDDFIPRLEDGFQFNCENLLGESKGLKTAKPSSSNIGKLGSIYFHDWIVETPHTLVPNYIAPFKIKK